MNTVIERTGFDPAQDADNGNRFLTGNGYMGVRGTIGEAGVQQMTAVNLAGIHHQKGQWEHRLHRVRGMRTQRESSNHRRRKAGRPLHRNRRNIC